MENIQVGFMRTGIYPFNPFAMDSSMGPDTNVGEVGRGEQVSEVPSQESIEKIPCVIIEKVLLENLHVPYNNIHYLVNVED